MTFELHKDDTPMSRQAVQLLDKLLTEVPPDGEIRLTPRQAMMIAMLGPQRIGAELFHHVKKLGPLAALQAHGLFSRHVVIVSPKTPADPAEN